MAPGRTRPSIKSLAEPVETSDDRGPVLHQTELHGQGTRVAEGENSLKATCSVAHLYEKEGPHPFPHFLVPAGFPRSVHRRGTSWHVIAPHV